MDKSFDIKKLDWFLITIVFLLVVIGLIVIFSATTGQGSGQSGTFYWQIIWFCIGLSFAALMFFIPAKIMFAMAYFVYTVAIFALTFVLFEGVGPSVERWISIGGITIQPSEFAKIAVVAALARFLSQCNMQQNRLRDLLAAFILIGIPVYLVNKQPDLGTSIVIISIILPMLYWAGIQVFTIFVLISPFISVVASFNFYFFLIWMLIVCTILYLSKKTLIVLIGLFIVNISVGVAADSMWNRLTEYQQNRILSFFDKEKDPEGASYQGLQSLYAIGSGGIKGKGFMKGTQSQLRFLPVQHTDFIFSVLGEEFGFIGASAVLLLFFLLIMRMVSIASSVKSRFESLIVIGFASILLFHIFVNTLMTVGWFPVTGMPLPLLSSGGSFLISIMAMMGMVLNFSFNKDR